MKIKVVEPAQTIKQKAFQFTIDKCVGCHACVVACSIENPSIQLIPWREVSTFNPNGYPEIPIFHFSLACNHCENAPCMKNCPALAYSRDKLTGAIVHHAKKCIGCKYCTWACPYDAPKFNAKTKVIEKCTFCNSRIINDLKPACANLCPTGALDFIVRPEEISHQNIPGFTDIGIKPAIKIIPSKTDKQKLIISEYQSHINSLVKTTISTKISIIEEWPLFIFTFWAMLLVSVLAASVIGFANPNPQLFIVTGAIATLLSLLHLGKKLRAWRSLLNLKNSWLSREIFSFSAFFGFGIVYLAIRNQAIIGSIALLFGIISLISIDKVYKLAIQAIPLEMHSAHVLLSSFLFTALFSEAYKAFIFIVIIKLILYSYRKIEMKKLNKNYRMLLSGLRLDMLISFPLIFWLIDIPQLFWWITISITIGEIIDRLEYYDELEIITPKRQMANELEKYK